ncbi:hypothetical protein L1987_58923 [Smallanthus sonchifolius]|uniref:Uncharacterized protein n=1 Tax=Smallanthus sonchifolius TaxID=185202 RepID=A0ACB9D4P1_9ASTR|nr:hypothetical protein L1987_58923 [Smallanthus sonchifolius]
MNPQDHRSPSSQPPELRQVLVLGPPPVFAVHEQYFSNRFHILKAYDSPLPTHNFLHAHAQSVKVVLCSAIGPITSTWPNVAAVELELLTPEMRFLMMSLTPP